MKERYKTPVLLIVLLLIVTLTVGRQGDTNTGKNDLDIPDSIPAVVATSFESIFANNSSLSDEARLLKTVPSVSTGGIKENSLILDKIYVNSFQVDVSAADAFQAVTDQVISPGDYSIIFFELLEPANISDLIYQFGMGAAPAGADTTVNDPESIEPIANAPQTSVLLVLRDDEWQKLTVYDANEGFEQTGNIAYAYFDRSGSVGAIVVSQNTLGEPGQTTSLTFEIFGRRILHQGKTEDNWLGISGFTTTKIVLPQPQASSLFIDGFLNGDTTGWAKTIL